MGLCLSDEMGPQEKVKLEEELKKSRDLDETLLNDNTKESEIIKLLLLGAGESGKSTLFKALLNIYGDGFTDDQKQNYVGVIRNNTLDAMKTLVEQEDLSKTQEMQTEEGKSARSFFKENFSEDRVHEEITEEVVRNVRALWNDPGIKFMYENRSNIQIMDSCKYFFDNLDRIADPKYNPTVDDILQARVRTTGITDEAFTIDGNKFQIVDVGGQRNERKKWIHCFQDVTAVIFVAALSEYDQLMFEDDTTNRMMEALDLFEEMCNSVWFRDTAMLLFLNKRDLFADKIEKIPLNTCPIFKDYEGKGYEEGVEFLTEKFQERNKLPDKDIYTSVTCATDTDNISKVFETVKDIIIRASLRDAGLC